MPRAGNSTTTKNLTHIIGDNASFQCKATILRSNESKGIAGSSTAANEGGESHLHIMETNLQKIEGTVDIERCRKMNRKFKIKLQI
jgi:hypothetical protein